MNKKIWDLYAPIYEKAMRMDQKYYAYMYKRISRRVVDKEVLGNCNWSGTFGEACSAGIEANDRDGLLRRDDLRGIKGNLSQTAEI